MMLVSSASLPLKSKCFAKRKLKSFINSKTLSDVLPICKPKFGGSMDKLLLIILLLATQLIDLSQCGSPVSSKSLPPPSSSPADHGAGNVDDTESSTHYHPHSPHSYHRAHHRHSKKSSHSTTPSPSPYHYYNADALYESRYYERPSREFSARSTSYPAIAAAASSQVGFASDTEFGGLAMATGHGGHSHHHGHSHSHGGGGHDVGYGHGHGHTVYKYVNKLDQSSLGLLGLLGLLSLLSNVLMLLTTTAAASMAPAPAPETLFQRVKRDTVMLVNQNQDDSKSFLERLSRLIIPSLNIVGHAKDGNVPMNCTYQEVCKINKVILETFPENGRPVSYILSQAIVKLLSDNKDRKGYHHQHPSKDMYRFTPNPRTGGIPPVTVEKHLTQAGVAGRNGHDCEIVYPTCEALDFTSYSSGNGEKRRVGEKSQLPLLISPDVALRILLG